MSTTAKTGPVPTHTYRGEPTSVDRLAALAGVGRTTMVRRLLILTPEEAVELGPIPDLAARRAAAEVVPRRRYLFRGEPRTIARSPRWPVAPRARCGPDSTPA